MAGRSPIVGAVRLPLLALTVGLAYGLIEGAISGLLSLWPGLLTWRTGNSPLAMTVAPWFYAGAYVVVGAFVSLFALAVPRVRWDVGLVALLVTASGFFLALLQGQLFSLLAAVLIGAGLGSVAVRWYRPRRDRLLGALSGALPLMVTACAGIGLLVYGGGRLGERWALARIPPAGREHPNVLLLVLDTQRAENLSAYGYSRPTSPRLERLAAEGTLFEWAIAPSAWTLPSHATMMTGLNLRDHRAGWGGQGYLDGRRATLAEFFRDRGYATGGFVANVWWTARASGLARGFLHYEDYYGNLADAGRRTVLGRYIMPILWRERGRWVSPARKSADDVNAGFLRWLEDVEQRPFFAWLNYLDVHIPFQPHAGFRDRFLGGERPREEDANYLRVTVMPDGMPHPTPERVRATRDRYDEAALYLDDRIGRLLDTLEAQGRLDRTIVILTSDHGEHLGEHGIVGHAASLFMQEIRVPLLLRYPPAVPTGVRLTRPVGLTDLPITITRLAGFGSGPFPGRSWLSASDGAEANAVIVSEIDHNTEEPREWPAGRGWVRSLVAGNWHFVLEQSGAVQLFNLARDPRESEDRSGTAEGQRLLPEFRTAMTEWIAGKSIDARAFAAWGDVGPEEAGPAPR